MVDRLSSGPASVSELARLLDRSMPATVQHLHVLETCGIIQTEKVGRIRTCHIESAVLSAAEGWIAGRRTEWERRFDRLGALLAERAASPTKFPREP